MKEHRRKFIESLGRIADSPEYRKQRIIPFGGKGRIELGGLTVTKTRMGFLLPRATYARATITREMVEFGRMRKRKGVSSRIRAAVPKKYFRERIETAGVPCQRSLKEYHARGHLIADQFGGPHDDPRNFILMWQEGLNNSDYRNLERKIASIVLSGQRVELFVRPDWVGFKQIPRSIFVLAITEEGMTVWNGSMLNLPNYSTGYNKGIN